MKNELCDVPKQVIDVKLNHEWQVRERDGIWTLTGDWQMAGKSLKVRCTTVISDAGNTMTGKWEHSSDGSNWQTLLGRQGDGDHALNRCEPTSIECVLLFTRNSLLMIRREDM